MDKEGRMAAILMAFVCFLCFLTISSGRVIFAAEGKLVLANELVKLPVNPSLESHNPNHYSIESSNQIQKKSSQHSNGTRASPPTTPKQANRNSNCTTWCIVKPSTSQEKLDDIIQYCCTQPKVDCKVIQEGGNCFLPPNKISDASVVMNIYYNLNGKNAFNCDFKGSGLIVTQDPSVGKCIYQA